MKQSLVLIMAAATLLAGCGNPKTAQNTDKTYVKIGENVYVGLREADGAADTDNASSSVEYSYDADKDEYTIDNEVYKYKMQLLDEDSAESCNILCNDLSYSFENVQSDESTENYRKI